MKIRVLHWLAAALMLAGMPALAQPGKAPDAASKAKTLKGPKGPKPLFGSTDIIHLTITAPFGTLTRGAIPVETPQPGTLAVVGDTPETLSVTLAPRGITRRRKEICPFPPLGVVFPTKPPSESLFRGQKQLKLVTHCKPAEAFQQYLLLEYAAYKLYNRLTPQSFNTRLAQIDYVDTAGRPVASRLGFFIEDDDDMAARNGLKAEKQPDRIPVPLLDAPAAARFALFQLMISNLDWGMNAGPAGAGCCHNARLIGAKGATANLIPVPYDFDFAGLVDAPYAAPPDKVKVANVRVRRYRGFCRHNEEVGPQAATLLGRRGELLATLDSIPGLDAASRRKAGAYLSGFFDQMDSPADFQARIVKTCI